MFNIVYVPQCIDGGHSISCEGTSQWLSGLNGPPFFLLTLSPVSQNINPQNLLILRINQRDEDRRMLRERYRETSVGEGVRS